MNGWVPGRRSLLSLERGVTSAAVVMTLLGVTASAAVGGGFKVGLASAASGASGKWSVVSTPDPAGKSKASNLLLSVACTSSANCWAVGRDDKRSGSASLNQALHWNGSKWSAALTPDPAGTSEAENSLSSVACTSADDCWAVGSHEKNSVDVSLNQALRWNGRKWSAVSTPVAAGASNSFLESVACPSADDCWAVGSYVKSSGDTLNQALRWNGRKWSVVSTPDPAGTSEDELGSVVCTSAENCWAVGGASGNSGATLNEALHWNGSKWSVVSTPDPAGTANSHLASVVCTSAKNCWAVGSNFEESPSATLNLALHWNGSKWSAVATPNPEGTSKVNNELLSVDCTSADKCWAVGFKDTDTAPAQLNQALRWNGSKWSVVSTPNPAGTSAVNNLLWVACTAAENCWAVGADGTNDALVNQALRWT